MKKEQEVLNEWCISLPPRLSQIILQVWVSLVRINWPIQALPNYKIHLLPFTSLNYLFYLPYDTDTKISDRKRPLWVLAQYSKAISSILLYLWDVLLHWHFFLTLLKEDSRNNQTVVGFGPCLFPLKWRLCLHPSSLKCASATSSLLSHRCKCIQKH